MKKGIESRMTGFRSQQQN